MSAISITGPEIATNSHINATKPVALVISFRDLINDLVITISLESIPKI